VGSIILPGNEAKMKIPLEDINNMDHPNIHPGRSLVKKTPFEAFLGKPVARTG
jgi:hypothetical protein